MIMASKESIKGVISCIEFLTKQNWDTKTISARIENFIWGEYNQIEFSKDGDFFFTKAPKRKSLYQIEEYRIWAHSEEEAKQLLEVIKKF